MSVPAKVGILLTLFGAPTAPVVTQPAPPVLTRQQAVDDHAAAVAEFGQVLAALSATSSARRIVRSKRLT
jgi:hypothetical protein